MNKVYIFPGQGSQKKGMGEGLFEQFQEEVNQADHILGYSIKELCLEDPDNKLNSTDYTQPALYVVNALSYLEKLWEDGQEPAFAAGHSLGEYTALVAAVGNGAAFGKGRDMAAWLGLVPRQYSTGGKQRLLGISKRGNKHLRTLLIHGARAALPHLAERPDALGRWLRALLARAHRNLVVVALANKLARIAWAVLSGNQTYQARLGR